MNHMYKLFLPVIILTVFIAFFNLGSFTLFDVDEAVFSTATKEMIESGDWITPIYNGENRYDKPILFYWLMAASYKMFGVNEFGARFPSALASTVLIIAVFFFVRSVCNDERAFCAAIASALSIYFLAYSHAAVTDMTLTLFIALSLFCFYLWIHGDAKSKTTKNMYHFGFYVFSALALLTKGLIGIVFPFGIAVVYMFVTDGWKGMKRVFSLKGIILFMLISLPWFVAQLAINGQEFFDQFFMKHHFKRYTGIISGHKGPLYYYIPVLLIGLFPWVSFLPAGIRTAWKEKDRSQIFALTWFAFIFVFFSFSTTKLPNYILPALPATAILIASGMTAQDRKWTSVSNIFLVTISVILGVAFFIARGYALNLGLFDVNWLFVLSITTIGMAVLSVYTIFTKKQSYIILSGLMIVFLSTLVMKAVPIASHYLQGSLHTYSLYAKERLRADDQFIVYGLNNPSIIFYSDRKAIIARNQDELAATLKDGLPALVITKTKDAEFIKNLGFTLLENDKQYALLERK
jgi:4-amino-4-deoxy-L-arabinose transferase-like glycosyltransferase